MTAKSARTIVACAFGIAVSMQLIQAQTWRARTAWGDPDLHGEWTSEGEYGVPFERPAQYGTRQFLTDEEYARRLDDIKRRDERDLAPVDVLSGRVEGPSAPIPHWREYNTTSRRTSLVVDPPDGRLPRERRTRESSSRRRAEAFSAASHAIRTTSMDSACGASSTAEACPTR